MQYIVFSNPTNAESYQAQADVILGYPESLDSLRWVGDGIHAPLEFGRAMHFAIVQKHYSEDKWALPKMEGTESINLPDTTTIVEELSEDWYPPRPEMPDLPPPEPPGV
jgi:hypothetical protein